MPPERQNALYKRFDPDAPLSGNSTGPTPTPTGTSVSSAPTRAPTDSRKPPDSTVSAERAAMTPYLYACNSAQKAIVSQAWSEAGQLAEAHAKWKPPGWFTRGSYQAAMDMYLGTDSKKDDPWFGTGKLKQNIKRQQGIHKTDEDWSPYWSYAYIYCDESKVPAKKERPKPGECERSRTPGKKVAAFTFPDDGTIFGWNAKYVVLCPRFFDNDILTLEQQTNNAKKDKLIPEVMDNWRKIKSGVLFHETYHWGPAEVSDPRCNRKPEIYDPGKVSQLARDENIKGSKTNAESWTQAAMACYLMQAFKLKTPPLPKGEAAFNAEVTSNNFTINDIEDVFFDSAPDWFESPVSLDASEYAPSNVETLDVGDNTATAASETPSSS
ncbi:MAG: hypothetical protein M1820_003688 [Bogoriella megaspora]|nr:MAG: hypothetical protein M1820_003688 [Bogoriella megaspora]